MLNYVVKRLLLLVVTLFGITVLTFVVTRLTPGDPAALRVQNAGSARAVGGYDDLIELNRRNLGLDKPMVLNLEGEDREVLARRALDDFLRDADFWKKDGEKRLARVTTIALKPALDRFPLLGTPNDPVPLDRSGKPKKMAPAGEQRQRLAALYPRLAGVQPADVPADPAAAFDFWKTWYNANRDRFDEARVKQLVADYFAAKNDDAAAAMRLDVLHAGGFAIPYVAAHLDADDLQTRVRVNRVLQAQTGFSFASSDEAFATASDDVMRSWRSWWRREQVAYSRYGTTANIVNGVTNTQFGLWMSQAAAFDFGDSYIQRRPVLAMMRDALPISLLISGLSILISYLIAIPVGIFSAVKRHTPADTGVTVILFALYSLPSFWVAGIFLLTLTGPPFLDWFPTRGLNSTGIVLGADGVTFGHWFFDRIWHLVLPVTCLTYGSLAFISRQMRSSMLETINQDFIRTARAKGASASAVIFKHALRNSLIPILTISASLLPELIGGAIIIESIFTIPGMGLMTFEAIVNRDYPVINAVLFFTAFLTLLGILLADLSYALVDPRISYS